MRKILAGILTLMMIFTLVNVTPGSAFASASRISEQKVKLADAIDSAKNLLDINTDNYNFNYNYNENRNGLSSWDLNWNSKKNTGGSIYVSVNSETGDITSFNSWDPGTGQTTTKIPKYSKEKAYEAVLKFVKKLAPLKFPQTALKDNKTSTYYDMPINSDTYSFNFTRQVNGLDFSENGINISIDKNTLNVRNYSLTWDNGSFADPAKAIGLEKAKKAFENKSGIELSYNIITDYNTKTQTPILVYTLKDGGNTIDALTGELLPNNYNIMYSEKAMDKANIKGAAARTPEEQKSIDASDKYISKDAAIEEAKKYLTIDDLAKLGSSSLYVNDIDNSGTWNLYWDRNDIAKKISDGMSASVDAVTGKIKSFSMYGNDFYPDKEIPVNYTTQQAIGIAQKFINTLEPDKFKMTTQVVNPSVTVPDKITDYNFNYVGSINGAKCNFDNFNITVNAFTGKIMNYSMNWNAIKLPTADGALKLEAAYKALYDKAKYNLKYIRTYNYNNDISKSGNVEIKLAYVLEDFSGMLDANNGTFLDYNGKPVVEQKAIKYTDIKGYQGENDISLLVDMGIIDDSSDTFRPNSAILQKDFIKMLIKSLGQSYVLYDVAKKDDNSAYNSYYDTAIQKNIITESQRKPDTEITRQEAAKLLIRTMGIGYLGEANNLFNLSLKDAKLIPNNYKGYVALATGLKILSSTNGSFNGAKKLTRGQTATAIVNYLKVDTNK